MNIKVICLDLKIIKMVVRYRYNYKNYRSRLKMLGAATAKSLAGFHAE